jgi:UDP-N-acetylenolpyruvoylglucosamine reductase
MLEMSFSGTGACARLKLTSSLRQDRGFLRDIDTANAVFTYELVEEQQLQVLESVPSLAHAKVHVQLVLHLLVGNASNILVARQTAVSHIVIVARSEHDAVEEHLETHIRNNAVAAHERHGAPTLQAVRAAVLGDLGDLAAVAA